MHDAVARECLAVRHRVGILDYSTLGKIEIAGPDAGEFLDRVYTNAWKRLRPGRCRYGLMLGEDGMIFDDGVTARLDDQRYLMFTSTANAAPVLAWLEQWLQTEWPDLRVYLTSVSEHWSNIALAGPGSREVVAAAGTDIPLARQDFPFMTFRQGQVAGVPARVFRISFSGELSYEINVPADCARHVWENPHRGRPSLRHYPLRHRDHARPAKPKRASSSSGRKPMARSHRMTSALAASSPAAKTSSASAPLAVRTPGDSTVRSSLDCLATTRRKSCPKAAPWSISRDSSAPCPCAATSRPATTAPRSAARSPWPWSPAALATANAST